MEPYRNLFISEVDMASLTIKNIPDDLYKNLKISANMHHRSINSELIHCLETVLLPKKLSPAELELNARLLRGKVKADLIDSAEIDEAKRAGRA